MNLLTELKAERDSKYKGGLYHRTQILFAYNSNHIEGSRLTEEQTRFIFETKSFFPDGDNPIRVDDVVETTNHFRLFDYMLDHAEEPLTEAMVKEYHRILKTGTTDAALTWFNVGEYKSVANTVGDIRTATPKQVPIRMKALLSRWNQKPSHTLEELADFHYHFETIHPFQDGNSRVGRMILFKECLAHGLTPFVILDADKMFYYRGLHEYENMPGYLIGTFQVSQDFYQELCEELLPGHEAEPEEGLQL